MTACEPGCPCHCHETRTVHFFDGADYTHVACGAANANLVNTTLPGRVSCDRCKTTRAWKAAA